MHGKKIGHLRKNKFNKGLIMTKSGRKRIFRKSGINILAFVIFYLIFMMSVGYVKSDFIRQNSKCWQVMSN